VFPEREFGCDFTINSLYSYFEDLLAKVICYRYSSTIWYSLPS
jgi:hypothetical protein